MGWDWGGGSYTYGNDLAGDRGPSQNRERGGGHRLGRWWPPGVRHRLDPTHGEEGVWADQGGDGLEEDRMGMPGWRKIGRGGAEEDRPMTPASRGRTARWAGQLRQSGGQAGQRLGKQPGEERQQDLVGHEGEKCSLRVWPS
jgi:hypothetical protein